MRPPTRRALSLGWRAWRTRRCATTGRPARRGGCATSGSSTLLSLRSPRRYWAQPTSARRGGLLDVGCGTGTLLDAAVAAGADAVGVDISSAMVEAARRRVPTATVVTADAQTADLLAAAPGRAVRPGGVAIRRDVLRRARGGVRKHPVRHGARRAPRVRVLAGGRDLHVLARPPCAHGAPGRSARPTEDRRARPDGPGQRRPDTRGAHRCRLVGRDDRAERRAHATTRSTAATASRNCWRSH